MRSDIGKHATLSVPILWVLRLNRLGWEPGELKQQTGVVFTVGIWSMNAALYTKQDRFRHLTRFRKTSPQLSALLFLSFHFISLPARQQHPLFTSCLLFG